MFGMCSFFLIVCLACQRHFASIVHYEQAGTHFDEDFHAKAKETIGQGVEFSKVTSSDPEKDAAIQT